MGSVRVFEISPEPDYFNFGHAVGPLRENASFSQCCMAYSDGTLASMTGRWSLTRYGLQDLSRALELFRTEHM